MNDFTAKDDWQILLQVIRIARIVQPCFLFKGSKNTWIKCLLETILDSSVKPTIVMGAPTKDLI